MQSWARRLIALAALAGAAWLDLAARGAQAHAARLLPTLQGDAVVALAGLAAATVVGLAIILALSPAGRARLGD